MHMIFGSVLQDNSDHDSSNDLVETEKQHVSGMLVALDSYPWKARSVRGPAGRFGCCVLAACSSTESNAADLLPGAGSLSIAADVRLDNRAELCAALGIKPAEPPALEDDRLIMLAYQKWGTGCVSHLLGDFAFVIWDEHAGQLFCARDIVGARPFYYHHAPSSQRFVFASDLLAISAHPKVPLQLNLAYVAASLQMNVGKFEHPELTYYAAIKKLSPAHCMTINASGLHCWAYWQPGQISERRYSEERDYIEELSALLKTSVSDRVAGTGPLGAHISGGLDSSSIAVLAHRILQSQNRAFTGFSWAPPLPEDPADLLPNDERKLVEEVRAAEGMSVRYTTLKPAHILAHARRDITLQPTTTLQFELPAAEDAASLGIQTMLSGWGGDELVAFNGRGYFADLLRRGHWLSLQRELSQRSRLHGGSLRRQWIERGLTPLLPPALLRLLNPEDYPPPLPYPTYLRPAFAEALAGVTPLTGVDLSERPGVRRMQITLLQDGHLSYRMEAWASHGATLGLTYSYPLLDQRVVEFALSIPDHLFFKNGWKRYLYRMAAAGILPDSLRWNKTKEDPAMLEGSKNARSEQLYAQLRAQLLARMDNPFVDVEQLLAAVDAGVPDTTQKQGNPIQANPGRAGWLAYVNPKAAFAGKQAG